MTTSPAQSTAQPPITGLSLPDGLCPDSIDTVPILASILSRLQNVSQTSATSVGSPAAASPSQIASGTGPLTIKDIPTATDDLKHNLQKARAQAREVPDIERSIEEQEEEIRELAQRIREQREVLEGLRSIGESERRERSEGGGLKS